MSEQRSKRDQRRDLAAMLIAAEQGDKTILPALRKLFDERPDLWEQVGNLALQAERTTISLAAGGNELTYDAIEQKAGRLRAELLGAEPAPLERLLVDRIVVCWLQVSQAERTCATLYRDGGSVPETDFHQRRLDAAHRRYLHAIRTLAQVRRLLGPSVQVNIAEKQLNLAQLG